MSLSGECTALGCTPACKSWPHRFLAVQPWATDFTSLKPGFLTEQKSTSLIGLLSSYLQGTEAAPDAEEMFVTSVRQTQCWLLCPPQPPGVKLSDPRVLVWGVVQRLPHLPPASMRGILRDVNGTLAVPTLNP